MQLSDNFTLTELTRSETATRLGIANEPSPEQIKNLRYLAVFGLQPFRDEWGVTTVTSGYRGPALNAEIGGVENSDHLAKGFVAAADFKARRGTLEEQFYWLLKSDIPYRQLILELDQNIIHMSMLRPERETLVREKIDGRLVYTLQKNTGLLSA